MAKCLFLSFLLTNAFLGLAIGEPETMVQDTSASPSSSPSQFLAEAPLIRKLGKDHQHSVSPTEAPQSSKEGIIPSHERSPTEPESERVLSSHEEVTLSKQHHRSFDKSIAGGGVILGGLATTFLVAVFCYIRTTARHKPDAATTTASTL